MKNKMTNCLYCYKALNEAEQDFHTTCANRMFGTKQAPIIDFNLKELEDLAKQIVIKSVAVTGVQPKLSLEIEKNKNELSRLTIVGLHGNYILKPPSTEYKELPQNEDVTMHLANLVKIKTAQHCLMKLASGEMAYITKRFDRYKNEKIALEDFCQLTENLTEHKYRGSIEKVAKTTHQFTTNKGFEVLQLFELVLFCYLTGNADMHLKNFALIENAFGEFELSPAYDLVSTALVIADDKEESALTINGKKSRLKKKDFDALASSMNINTKVVESIYVKFERALPNWIDFIKQSFLTKSMQKNYIELLQVKYQNLFH
ncbi:MAG TPA: HipA domain-containing protein [Niabella sp.]|nr:HipA domain-containing protein [Niabella sp.]HQX42625.1 HipA domain-containing protein [Niabella sp.]HRB05836.1 HipA domain-containing protein [Niabella sp.]HRB34986.1 HipA domain-containing protein [Niabella sp.]HRB41458.1 HipA domain-containing protein [Niabella sp.]